MKIHICWQIRMILEWNFPSVLKFYRLLLLKSKYGIIFELKIAMVKIEKKLKRMGFFKWKKKQVTYRWCRKMHPDPETIKANENILEMMFSFTIIWSQIIKTKWQKMALEKKMDENSTLN